MRLSYQLSLLSSINGKNKIISEKSSVVLLTGNIFFSILQVQLELWLSQLQSGICPTEKIAIYKNGIEVKEFDIVNLAKLRIAKFRDGEPDVTIPLYFNKEQVQFTDYEYNNNQDVAF